MFGPGRGFGGFIEFLGDLAQLIGAVVLVGVLVGVTVLLVRFLLVATKAAQLYVDRHAPEKPEAPTVDYRRPAPTAPAAAASAAAPAPAPAPAPVNPEDAVVKADEVPAPKSASAHASAATGTGITDTPAKPAPKPRTTKPRTPKAPPAG